MCTHTPTHVLQVKCNTGITSFISFTFNEASKCEERSTKRVVQYISITSFALLMLRLSGSNTFLFRSLLAGEIQLFYIHICNTATNQIPLYPEVYEDESNRASPRTSNLSKHPKYAQTDYFHDFKMQTCNNCHVQQQSSHLFIVSLVIESPLTAL